MFILFPSFSHLNPSTITELANFTRNFLGADVTTKLYWISALSWVWRLTSQPGLPWECPSFVAPLQRSVGQGQGAAFVLGKYKQETNGYGSIPIDTFLVG